MLMILVSLSLGLFDSSRIHNSGVPVNLALHLVLQLRVLSFKCSLVRRCDEALGLRSGTATDSSPVRQPE